MPRYERFILSPLGGTPGNEYRIKGSRVEFRRFNEGVPRGQKYDHWRTLTPNDVLMHLSLNTEVGKWLMKRLQTRDVA